MIDNAKEFCKPSSAGEYLRSWRKKKSCREVRSIGSLGEIGFGQMKGGQDSSSRPSADVSGHTHTHQAQC